MGLNNIKLNFTNVALLGIILTIIGITITYYLIHIKKRCFVHDSARELQDKNIRNLLRQSARWITAAEQDESLLIKVLHANYGVGYLWALLDIASDTEIENATSVDMNKFRDNIIKVQDKVTTTLIKVCPDYAPNPTYLAKIGGEGA